MLFAEIQFGLFERHAPTTTYSSLPEGFEEQGIAFIAMLLV